MTVQLTRRLNAERLSTRRIDSRLSRCIDRHYVIEA